MQKDNNQFIELKEFTVKRVSKTITSKDKNSMMMIPPSYRNRCFSTQIPKNFVPCPKAIKPKFSPPPMTLNSSAKKLKSQKSFQPDHEVLYLSFHEESSDYDSDTSFNETTDLSNASMSSFRKELCHMKSINSQTKAKDFEDTICCRAMSYFKGDDVIIPKYHRRSLQYIKGSPLQEKGFSILNILELSQ